MILIPADLAAVYCGRPASTIRRWAAEGRITRYGTGRGQVRYHLDELPHAHRDEETGEWVLPDAPPLPQAQTCAA